jgi:hypothetical protein
MNFFSTADWTIILRRFGGMFVGPVAISTYGLQIIAHGSKIMRFYALENDRFGDPSFQNRGVVPITFATM